MGANPRLPWRDRQRQQDAEPGRVRSVLHRQLVALARPSNPDPDGDLAQLLPQCVLRCARQNELMGELRLTTFAIFCRRMQVTMVPTCCGPVAERRRRGRELSHILVQFQAGPPPTWQCGASPRVQRLLDVPLEPAPDLSGGGMPNLRWG